jgi:hypothetical protein
LGDRQPAANQHEHQREHPCSFEIHEETSPQAGTTLRENVYHIPTLRVIYLLAIMNND